MLMARAGAGTVKDVVEVSVVGVDQVPIQGKQVGCDIRDAQGRVLGELEWNTSSKPPRRPSRRADDPDEVFRHATISKDSVIDGYLCYNVWGV